MTPWQLIALRCYMLTLGRFGPLATLLRTGLERLLVRGKKRDGYHASSDFFDFRDLDRQPERPEHSPRASGSRSFMI